MRKAETWAGKESEAWRSWVFCRKSHLEWGTPLGVEPCHLGPGAVADTKFKPQSGTSRSLQCNYQNGDYETKWKLDVSIKSFICL